MRVLARVERALSSTGILLAISHAASAARLSGGMSAGGDGGGHTVVAPLVTNGSLIGPMVPLKGRLVMRVLVRVERAV